MEFYLGFSYPYQSLPRKGPKAGVSAVNDSSVGTWSYSTLVVVEDSVLSLVALVVLVIQSVVIQPSEFNNSH